MRPDDRIYAENGAITIAATTIHDWKKYGWLDLRRGAAELVERRLDQGGPGARPRALLPIHEGVRLRRAHGRRPRRREPRAAARPAALVAPVAADHVHRPGDLGDGAAARRGVRRHRQRRHADAAPAGAVHVRCRGREARRFEPQAVRQVISPETARTLTRLLAQVVESGTGASRRSPATPSAARPGQPRSSIRRPGVTRARRASCRSSGFAPADEPRFVDARHARRAQERKVGQRGRGADLRAIGREVLRYLEVPPRDSQPVQIVTGGRRRRRPCRAR